MKLRVFIFLIVLLFTNCFTLIAGTSTIWIVLEQQWDKQEAMCREREARKFWVSYHFFCEHLEFEKCLEWEINGYQSGAHLLPEPDTFKWEIIKGNLEEAIN